MKVLVTGAAGYIGGAVVSMLSARGDQVIGLDNLSRGSGDVLDRVPHAVGDFGDADLLSDVFDENPDIDAVVHCAARTDVSESVASPMTHYMENVGKTLQLLDVVRSRRCRRFVFTSSAAVYGEKPPETAAESAPVDPSSPYAATKLMIERVLADLSAAGDIQAISLRCFNAAGGNRPSSYDGAAASPPDVFSAILSASISRLPFVINGSDWETADGTPVRDFIHVLDVARAHVLAVDALMRDRPKLDVINIGSGRRVSILELARSFIRDSSDSLDVVFGPRRRGDTVGCIADISHAKESLGWRPIMSVDDILMDAKQSICIPASLLPTRDQNVIRGR